MLRIRIHLVVLICLITSNLAISQRLPIQKLSSNKVWIDPALDNLSGNTPVVIWFDEQFLGSGDAYLQRTKEFEGQKRSDLRKKVVTTLKTISAQSFAKVAPRLEGLEESGDVSNIRSHWVINGFSCTTNAKGLKAIAELPGVSKIFRKRAPFVPNNRNYGPEYLEEIPTFQFDPQKVKSYPWNIEQIRAPEVWEAYDIIGEGTLNVVHDFGFKLDVPPLAQTIYVNTDEIPGNNKDDDGNGLIDDYHGYNFDAGNANINEPNIRRATIIHGNACAGMISGTMEANGNQAIGIAPGSKWAPVIGAANIEQAVEWAIEQGADTYSMSFSQPNLGEFRSHWRKVMEQASFCGVVFISGAGNFAAGNGYAPTPVQMRNPEDIPNAVLGVAGVGRDGKRPVFSSQGPVEWNTAHYQEGRVNKPDFATLNFQINCLDLEGNLTNRSSGNSFAGPHMAGIVALMLSANPELLPWEVKEILIKTAKDIGDPGFDYQSGHGFVNAYDAVTEALKHKK